MADDEERPKPDPPLDPLSGLAATFTFDPATVWTPYQRLAAAVILHAVTDRRETEPDSAARDRIDDFLLGRTKPFRVMRDHWFRQAGLPIPTNKMVRSMIRRLEFTKNAEYRVIEREPKCKPKR